MRYYAAHRIWLTGHEEMLSMCRVGVDADHHVVLVEPFEGEPRQTEWLGGIIIVSPVLPEREADEGFFRFCDRLRTSIGSCTSMGTMYAFHVSPFRVREMEFAPESRFRRL